MWDSPFAVDGFVKCHMRSVSRPQFEHVLVGRDFFKPTFAPPTTFARPISDCVRFFSHPGKPARNLDLGDEDFVARFASESVGFFGSGIAIAADWPGNRYSRSCDRGHEQVLAVPRSDIVGTIPETRGLAIVFAASHSPTFGTLYFILPGRIAWDIFASYFSVARFRTQRFANDIRSTK
jgi:hypothetical protein